MGKAAVIFPGQGAQSVGMGKDVVERSSLARGIFETASRLLDYDIAELCFEGPADRLAQTDIQQPAIFVTGVAIWEAFLEAGGTRELFAFAGGLSLGEYTALHIAGAISFEDALELVHCRGRLMQAAAEAQPGGMVSLIGLDEDAARALCDRAREGGILAPANFNCPGQIVISGDKEACERAVVLADELSCRAIPLKVAGAFHSPLMDSAAAGLEAVFDRTTLRTPVIPVVANVDATYHSDPSSIRRSLCRQVTEPVLWQRCVERMIADGVDEFVEFGPGRVLTGLMRKIDRSVTTTNVSTADALASVVPA